MPGHKSSRYFPKSTRLSAIAVSAVAALFWVLLAWRTPTSTYHFAPIVVALAGPVMANQRSFRLSLASALPLVLAATALAVASLLVLGIADKLRGPTFWSHDGAALEAALFTGVSAFAALALLSFSGAPDPGLGDIETARESVDAH